MNDAADIGFVLVSQKTKVSIPFYLDNIQRDAEHDIKFWEFLPCSEAVRRNPGLEGVKVIVFND